MIKNYIVISLRSLLKNKVFSFINIFGLSLAIACSIIVVLFVKNEFTYDQFHQNAEQIYRPFTHAIFGEKEEKGVHTPFIMGKQLRDNYEEVKAYTVLTSFRDQVYYDQVQFEEEVHIVSEDFFKIFSFKPLSGNPENVLKDPSDLVVTKEMAEKYFGTDQVLGQTISIQTGGERKQYVIKMVLEDLPSNSSLQFNFIISDHHLKDLFPEQMLTSWNMITGETFVLLEEGVDPEILSTKFGSLIEQVMGDDLKEFDFFIHLQPLTDIHLNTDLPQGNIPISDPKYTYILLGIAALILIIACINFVTLSLGRSLSRGKEIGIRKVSGATQTQVFTQFMSESVITAFLGLIVGIALVFIMIPYFNDLSGSKLKFSVGYQDLILYGAITLLTGILAGLYPALIVSGYKPVKILKGNQNFGKGKDHFGTILVAGQFVLTVFMIGCTLVMKNQLNYLQNKNLGFDKERVIAVEVDVGDAKGVRNRVQKGFEQSKLFANKLNSLAEVNMAAVGSHTFEKGTWTEIGYNDENDQEYKFFYNTVSPEFLPLFKIEIVEGRNFNYENISDSKRAIIVNESFVREFGLTDPIGKRINNDEFIDHEIIGVIKDFHFQSLHAKIEPLVLTMNVEIGFSGAHNVSIGSSVTPKLFIRLVENKIEPGLKQIRNIWSGIYPTLPFDYSFIEDNLLEQYKKEQNLEKIVTGAALLAIIVGCMGLFGLSILSFNSRLKEISIRKVLGASGNNIFYILSRKFVILSGVALFVSIPLTYYTMNIWLNEFQYKISVGPIIFIIAGIISMAISLLTISYQGFNVIRTNPAVTLRNE